MVTKELKKTVSELDFFEKEELVQMLWEDIFNKQENIYRIQKLLRNKDIRTTLATYTHFYSDYKPDSFDNLSKNFKDHLIKS